MELTEAQSQLATVQAENEKLRDTQSATEFELPEASDLLNQLKAKRKKSKAELADVEALLEMIEGSTPIRGK
ncbi:MULTISPECIES: flagellar alpha dynein [unclassified Microcoleus]|uniref:flagellar alpha dynein n=1 Tax=unclassified Microcoleus TaxID=2642155 RepID=UPI002FD26A78